MERLKNAAKMMWGELQGTFAEKGSNRTTTQFYPQVLFRLITLLPLSSTPRPALFTAFLLLFSFSIVCVHSCPCMLLQSMTMCLWTFLFSPMWPSLRASSFFKTQNNSIEMSHPFHLLPLRSVTPVSTPSLMDFQMQVHNFYQDLTGIFLCV